RVRAARGSWIRRSAAKPARDQAAGFGFSSGGPGGPGRQTCSAALQYSKIFTTLRTPPVVRARSTASSASRSVTTPIRYTTPASVTTLTCTGLKAFALRRSEEHTSELQSRGHLVCRLLLEKK